VFQLDIHHGRRGPYFRLWPGRPDIEFGVLDADADLRQVVLRVCEPRRRFEEHVTVSWWSHRDAEAHARRVGGRILGRTRRRWVIERWTEEGDRRYLAGIDHQAPFIAQVGEAGTVPQAHDWLKPALVRLAEARRPGTVARQGEWFFVPVAAEEMGHVAAYAASHPRSARRVHPVGPGRRPHVADEYVRVDRRERRASGGERRRLDVYVRGRVLHPDHDPVCFAEWRRAVLNRAILPPEPEPERRVRWID
jgi:hypothetical protein